MNFPVSKLVGVAALTAFILTGCKQESAVPQADASASAAPHGPGPDAKPGVAVSNGKLVLPAVKGRPGAAYFDLANTGSATVTLAAVQIDGAGKAEMHETKDGKMNSLPKLDVPPASTVSFARGGKHVMVFDLDDKIVAGGTAEMTLTFADGDKISTPVAIEPAGGAMAEMPGMKH